MKRLTDAEIVEHFLLSYNAGDTGTAWNWFVVKMSDEVREEFDIRLEEQRKQETQENSP